MPRRRNQSIPVLLLLAGLALAGCSSTPAAVADAPGPAQVQPIAGTGRSQVILTADAAKRIGLTTVPVATATGSTGLTVVPMAAVLYDKDGKTWAYTSPAPLTFVPKELVIARIEGDRAYLKSGPTPGTPVVTIGGAELLGAEYGVPGEQ